MATTRLRFLAFIATFALVMAGLPGQALADPGTRLIFSSGTTTMRDGPIGSDSFSAPEIDLGIADENEARTPPATNGSGVFPSSPLAAPKVRSSRVANSNPELAKTFDGLNFRQQRVANRGNQFSVEPPDQGLCAGNGFVLETVNDVLRVFSMSDGAVTGVVDLNTFYNYPPAIVRGATNVLGPSITDPVCLFDGDTQRWYHVVLTLDRVGTRSRLSGGNHLDIAVSNTPDPTGLWTIYKVDVTDNGRRGTPDHHCAQHGVVIDGREMDAAIGDYPHIGADANGVYISTNEYCFFQDGYNGAQIYAFSKARLATHPAAVAVTHIENTRVAGTPGFTVWPAVATGRNSSRNGGTEYFLSSIAGDGSETGNPTGTANKIALWTLTNTSSLNGATPSLNLRSQLLRSETYVFPPKSVQKPGSTPLRECINDNTLVTPFGPGCWQLVFFPPQPPHEDIAALDSNDTRMQQVTFADGKVWGALDTGVMVDGQFKAGIAWFAVDVNGGGDDPEVSDQGYIALAHNNLTYPALTVMPNGQAVMAFTVLGDDFFPSAGYATLTEDGAGSIHIAAAGLGPDDGFTNYNAFFSPPVKRPRWGDYGAAVVVGNDVWIASEYIGQTCSFAQFTAGVSATSFGSFGSCGGTRGSLGNWGTRISKLTLKSEDEQ